MKKKIITHNGNFHTDEVFASAVLALLNDGNIEIVRSRDPEVWATGDYVVDVCGEYDPARGLYDHHQEGGAGARENGIPYSSFGLVWKEYGEKVSGSPYVARVIDERIVQPVDAGDNAVRTFEVTGSTSPYILQDLIASFRPGWNEKRTADEGFFEAVELSKKILEREIARARTEEEGNMHTEEAYQHAEDKRIVILEDHFPWYEALATKSEPLFVVKPDRGMGGKWKIEAILSDIHRAFVYKKLLPGAWAGKMNAELAAITGVPGALFCHNKRFVAVADSKEGALKLAQIAVEAE